jgi:nitrogen-specific signal transduction histidine kinase
MSAVDIALLLTDPPGNLIYHFTLAMSLGVILSLALIYRTRLKENVIQRFVVVSAALLGFRLLLLFIDGLIWFDVMKMNNLIASADRFLSLFALLAFTWLLDLPTPKYSRWFFAAGLAVMMIILIASPMILKGVPKSVPLNKTGIDISLSFLSLAVTLFIAIVLVTLRPKGWDLAASPYALMAIGLLLHIANGPKTAYAAGYVRFAEIAAYPLFAILTAKVLASLQVDVVFEAKELFREPTSLEVTTLMVAISDLTTLFASKDQTQLTHNAVEIIAKRMNSDYCLLIIPYEDEGKLVVAAGFDLFQDNHMPRTSLSSANLPLIADALHHGKSLVIQKDLSAHELRALKPLITQGISGPTLFVPLSFGKRVLGGFLLISHSARQLWSSKDREAMELLAELLSQRFQELKRSADRANRGEEYKQKMQNEQRIKSLEQEKQYLEEAIEVLRSSETSIPYEDLQSLMDIHEKDQKEIEQLRSELLDLKVALENQEVPAESDDLELVIGERLIALQELAETRQSLSEIKDQMISSPVEIGTSTPDVETIISIAEELRQSMSSISGYTELLMSESIGSLGAMQRKFLDRIRSASDQLGSNLNALLRASTGDVKVSSIPPSPIEVMHCLEDAIAQVQPKMQQKNIVLRMDIPDETYNLLGDEETIIQSIYHLLDNAIGASPIDGEVIIIMREQKDEPNSYLMISVADSGNGIPASDIQRVFQGTSTEDKGKIAGIGDDGIGLSIVKSMSEKLGGRVWVDTEIGEGSVFTILLPMLNLS